MNYMLHNEEELQPLKIMFVISSFGCLLTVVWLKKLHIISAKKHS